MNPRRFILRSLRHYRRSHLWIVLGVAMSTAVLVGALVVGDSVRYSLQHLVTDRLGRTRFAASPGDRFYRSALADALSERLGTDVAPILLVKGMAVLEGGRRRANRVSVVGVDSRFGQIGGAAAVYDSLSADEAIVNRTLAAQLGVRRGDVLLLRLDDPGGMPGEAPLSAGGGRTTAVRLEIARIAGDAAFGRFDLEADQVTPGTAFVSLDALGELLDVGGLANGMLVAERPDRPLAMQELDTATRGSWALEDAGLEWRTDDDGERRELRSRRVFIQPEVLDAAREAEVPVQPVLTYFVNAIRKRGRATPYSFVAAPGAPIVPPGMRDNEILLNRWVADDLDASAGDAIQLEYFVLGNSGSLSKAHTIFTVRDVVPLQGAYRDPGLLPDFPGLADEPHCRDWETGIPVDFSLIRQKDEDYWDELRGTPKAFVTLAAAQGMWQNRFGSLTALRFFRGRSTQIESRLIGAMDPAGFGLSFRDVRLDGMRASTQSVDFAQLFLGLSFFVIAASLLLTGLFFVFHLDTRAREAGVLLALGFPAGAVRRMTMGEGAVLVCAGSILGGLVGPGVTQVILRALETVWQGAVGATALRMHVAPLTLLSGVCVGAALALGVIWLTVRRRERRPIADLQRGASEPVPAPRRLSRTSVVLAVVSAAAAVLLVSLPHGGARGGMAAYFAAGTLVLVGGLAVVQLAVHLPRRASAAGNTGLLRMSLQNLGRRRHRGLALVGLLASGLFLVFTVGANRKSAALGAHRRDAGTGGFALFCESTVPLTQDLNQAQARRDYGLESLSPERIRFVQFRVREGEDASCLNLNRVTRPQLLGVDPGELSRRGAFSFASMAPGVDPQEPWLALDPPQETDIVPAIADLTVIHWGLGKSVGDTLLYTDEKGAEFRVRLVAGLANSVFQGNLILSEGHLLDKYPSLSGYQVFLVDAPPGEADDAARRISWALQDHGTEVTRATDHLAAFNQVENTYLSIFLILGGLGLILGSVGIGIVVLRNIEERRGELALLRAVGFSRGKVRRLVLYEHLALLLGGAAVGISSALVATYPTLASSSASVPLLTVGGILAAVILNGFAWAHLASSFALRGSLLPALRSE